MRIFVTGAAGLIGGEVARRLVARGHSVTAGVHRNRDVRGNDGAAVAVAGTHHDRSRSTRAGPRRGGRARDGRRSRPDPPLRRDDAVRSRPMQTYRATNVAGTAAMLDARRARRPAGALRQHRLCLRATATAGSARTTRCPPTGSPTATRRARREAEALVAAASPRHVIARPSIVVGDSVTGAIRSFDTIYAAFKLIAEGRVRHMPARADATLDFVPIDHVAGGLVALAERIEAAAGGRFHLVSGEPVPVADWAAAIGAYPQFTAPDAMSRPTRSIRRRCPRSNAGCSRASPASTASYFQRDPRFDDTAIPRAHRARLPADRSRLSHAR